MNKDSIVYLTKVITTLIEPLRGTGIADKRVQQDTEANLRESVCTLLSQGDFRIGRGDSQRKGLFAFTGKRYEYIDDVSFIAAIRPAMQSVDIGIVYRAATPKKLYDDMCSNGRLKDFAPTKGVISFRNRVLELDTMKMHDHSGEFMTQVYLDIDYDPRAKAPRWEQFMHEVLNEEESIMVLQEFLGYMFVDRNKMKIEAMLFLYGTGANGKSVILSVLQKILGNYMTSASMKALCASMHSDYHLAAIDGKLLNFSPDEGTESFSTGIYKNLVGGDPVQVRPIGEKPYMATNMPLLACNINKIPQTTDTSNGYFRRMLIIPFTRVFTEETMDKKLPDKLAEELSGVFNWIMEGRKRLIANDGHFTMSAQIANAKVLARLNSNSVLQFLADNNYYKSGSEADGDKMHRYGAKEFRDMYVKYCEDMGFQPKSMKNLREDLVNEGFEFKKTRIDSNPMGGATNGFVVWEKMVYDSDNDDPEAYEDEDDAPF